MSNARSGDHADDPLAEFITPAHAPAPEDVARLRDWLSRLDVWLHDRCRPIEHCRLIFPPHQAARRAMLRLSIQYPSIIAHIQAALGSVEYAWQKWDSAGRPCDEAGADSLLQAIGSLADRLRDAVGIIESQQASPPQQVGGDEQAAPAYNPNHMASPRELAEQFGVKPETLRHRLRRWRENNPDSEDRGWAENIAASSTAPQYRYRIGHVLHLLHKP